MSCPSKPAITLGRKRTTPTNPNNARVSITTTQKAGEARRECIGSTLLGAWLRGVPVVNRAASGEMEDDEQKNQHDDDDADHFHPAWGAGVGIGIVVVIGVGRVQCRSTVASAATFTTTTARRTLFVVHNRRRASFASPGSQSQRVTPPYP
jgi:hypothetical protein